MSFIFVCLLFQSTTAGANATLCSSSCTATFRFYKEICFHNVVCNIGFCCFLSLKIVCCAFISCANSCMLSSLSYCICNRCFLIKFSSKRKGGGIRGSPCINICICILCVLMSVVFCFLSLHVQHWFYCFLRYISFYSHSTT